MRRVRVEGMDRLSLLEMTVDGERVAAEALDASVTDAERAAAGRETLRHARRRLLRTNRRLAQRRWETREAPLPLGSEFVRVWRARPLDDLCARLGGERARIWADGDILEALWRGNTDRLECAGGLQYPFWRAGRSDIWELSVRVPRLAEAIISLIPIPLSYDAPHAFGGTLSETPLHFRGAHAAPEPPLDELTPANRAQLEGLGLGAARNVSAWRPPGSEDRLPVFYCADFAAESLARAVGPAIRDGRLPPVMLVGIESGTSDERIDRRRQEYLPGVSRSRFRAHERFVLDVVRPWAEREHGASRQRSARYTLGFSNGATWALAMAQRSPSTFGGAIGFSVAGQPPKRIRHHPDQTYALCAGTLETGFATCTRHWAKALGRNPTADVDHTELVAGHDFQAWLEQTPTSIASVLRRAHR
jgi:enterochelin esterase-like enzyme